MIFWEVFCIEKRNVIYLENSILLGMFVLFDVLNWISKNYVLLRKKKRFYLWVMVGCIFCFLCFVFLVRFLF